MSSPEHRRVVRTQRLAEASLWVLLLTLVLPIIVFVAAFIAVVVILT